MATIAISNLHSVGSDFFADSESYMNELSEQELHEMQGGGSPAYALVGVLAVGIGIAGYQIGRQIALAYYAKH